MKPKSISGWSDEDVGEMQRRRFESGSMQDSSTPASLLSEILLASITALADAGEIENACRLAGQACVALRGVDPAMSRRFDVLLHRLTPSLEW